MPMTQIPLSGLETETDSVASKTSTLQDIVHPAIVSNTQKDILHIIRKEEDHAMSLLAASPLLSSLFLTYANRAAALDGPPSPSPIDMEWAEMKALNKNLQDEVASLRAEFTKETERAKVAEDCVEALRAQLSFVKNANSDLEASASDERAKLETITAEYTTYKKEATKTLAELCEAVDKGEGARAALSQVIADQQMTLVQLKEKNGEPLSSSGARKNRQSETLTKSNLKEATKRTNDSEKQEDFGGNGKQDEAKQKDHADGKDKLQGWGGSWGKV